MNPNQSHPLINPGTQVPIVGQADQPIFLPVMVQITERLKEKLVFLAKERGIDGQSLVQEIVARGLASIYLETELGKDATLQTQKGK